MNDIRIRKFLDSARGQDAERELNKLVVLNDEHTVGATNGFVLHAVRDYPVPSDLEISKKNSKGMRTQLLRNRQDKVNCTFHVDANLLHDAIKHFATQDDEMNVIELRFRDKVMEINGNILDDGAMVRDAHVVIMKCITSRKYWVPEVKPPEEEKLVEKQCKFISNETVE